MRCGEFNSKEVELIREKLDNLITTKVGPRQGASLRGCTRTIMCACVRSVRACIATLVSNKQRVPSIAQRPANSTLGCRCSLAGRCVSHKTATRRTCCTQPVVYLVNLSANDFIRKKNKWLAKIHAWIQVRPASFIKFWGRVPLPGPASRHNAPPALLES